MSCCMSPNHDKEQSWFPMLCMHFLFLTKIGAGQRFPGVNAVAVDKVQVKEGQREHRTGPVLGYLCY